jgi:hypothetical protein
LNKVVEGHILKIIMGPRYLDSKHLSDKERDYRDGLLDDYNCFLYIPPLPSAEKSMHQQFSYIKVKDIRKYMFEVFTDELFGMIDIDDFVRNEIETKAIVVIDEIDKLVRSGDTTSTTKASDEGVQYDLLPILDGTTVSVN